MLRAVAVGMVALAVPAALAGCGGQPESISSEEIARDAEREQRLARLERRVKRLRERRPPRRPRSERREPSGFDRFAAGLNGDIGLTLGPVGRTAPRRFGALTSGSAWSTIKVPIAVRVLDGGSSSAAGQVERALTASDNAAADALFESLGDPQSAASAVTEVLREAGDTSTKVSSVGRASFSPYGQTEWPLVSQHRFMASLAGGCVGRPATRDRVLGLMGQVTSDRWGLGSVGAQARWKGGWGPGTDGRYLVRQMGVVETSNGPLVVTLGAVASDGSFSSGQALATKVARWAVANGGGAAGRKAAC